MVTRFLSCFVFATTFLTVVSVCQAKAPDISLQSRSTENASAVEKQSPYVVLDSGVWADWISLPQHYWLDNHRVIFIGSKTRKKIGSTEKQIQIWDTRTNEVKPYTEAAPFVHFCYSEGFIDYSIGNDKKNLKRFAGEFGKEKPFVLPAENKNAVYYPMDCKFYDEPAIAMHRTGTARRLIKPLKRRHGYLDYGLRSTHRLAKQDEPLLFYRSGYLKPIRLPTSQETVRHADYYEFKGAYFVRFFNTNRDTWWLYPDGRIEAVKYPPMRLSRGQFFPTREGFFVSYEAKVKSNRDPGETGGYLITENGKEMKLISGFTNGDVVSPDGCKIAFSHYPYDDATLVADPTPITLKMINFCTEEKK